MERIRDAARKKLADAARGAPAYADEAALTAFAADLDAAIAERCPTPRRYRDRVLFLAANLPTMRDDLGDDTVTPAYLSEVSDVDLVSAQHRRAEQREARKRARQNTITIADREDVKCDRCGLPIRARLNVNRFEVEDELLGAQFQNQYDVLCECDADKDLTAHFGEGSGSDGGKSGSESDSDTTGSESSGVARRGAKANRSEGAPPLG